MSNVTNMQRVIKHVHGCRSAHIGQHSIKEVFKGVTAWEGAVEVFDLENHPEANRCYAWSFKRGNKTEYVTILEIPPVKDAQTAVQTYLVSLAEKPE